MWYRQKPKTHTVHTFFLFCLIMLPKKKKHVKRVSVRNLFSGKQVPGKKKHWKRSCHLWVFRVHCGVMRTDKTRAQASSAVWTTLLQSKHGVLAKYYFNSAAVQSSVSYEGRNNNIYNRKHCTSFLNSYSQCIINLQAFIF